MSRQDLEYQVSQTLGDHIEDFDIPAIVTALQKHYGELTSIDQIDSDHYWEIVRQYDGS